MTAAERPYMSAICSSECHMLVSYQGVGGETKSEKLLYDEVFYKAFQNHDSCYVMVDDNGIRHYHPSE
ncbi:hypothetical protein [Pseudoalteromonas piscicida]|uniref:hypothetical protein n=1 Tax=Pseudoalteromonas piscicida TaxID=43662 RepID=UPI00124443D1|nr:hypothetical protein [Pseudoalteromonas piscicida]